MVCLIYVCAPLLFSFNKTCNNTATSSILLINAKANCGDGARVAASRLFLYDVDCWLTDNNMPARIWNNGGGKLRHVYQLITAVS